MSTSRPLPNTSRERKLVRRTSSRSPGTPVRIADAMREVIKPVNPGVMPVLLLDPSLALHARGAVEVSMLAGKKIADLPMPCITALKALYGNGSRDADFAQMIARTDGRPATITERLHVLTLADCRNINALSDEGIHIMLSQVGEKECVTAQQSVNSEPNPDIVDALVRLDAGAREKDAVVMLFLHCASGLDALWLQEYCHELIVVDRCEPGPGASIAFSIAAMSLHNQHADGIGKIMCEVFPQRSRWSRRYTTFIAASAQDRAMWHMRQEGDSLKDIAALMDMHKTTAMRRLNDLLLSPGLEVKLPDGWRDQWLPFLGLDVDDEDADDDEDSGDAEDEHQTPGEASADGDEDWDEPDHPSGKRKIRF
ncbi:hypothetical protein SAMN04487926_101479 [Paraburkholderia steynii]|uniref:Uncharacterized protein n=1 Tax=Paraburkholderia steynii TaxID=1245441 RepID=A0A7Z7B0D1_9BURK|nr:hypothetical protein [Paraburkholderia steynii]SDG97563.1 hypothetical protein SAMN04487926_101479 [Paraburkholderia steynii]